MRTISDLSREYHISRAAVAAVLDEHDVPICEIGSARCVRDEDLTPVLPVFAKLGRKAQSRRLATAQV